MSYEDVFGWTRNLVSFDPPWKQFFASRPTYTSASRAVTVLPSR